MPAAEASFRQITASGLQRKDEFRGYPNKLGEVIPVSEASREGTMEALLRCRYENGDAMAQIPLRHAERRVSLQFRQRQRASGNL